MFYSTQTNESLLSQCQEIKQSEISAVQLIFTILLKYSSQVNDVCKWILHLNAAV